MSEGYSMIVTPAIIIALISVIFQGVQACVDLFDRWRQRKIAEDQRRIAMVTALLSLIEEIPASNAAKAKAKVDTVKEWFPGGVPATVAGLMSRDY